MTDNIIQKKDAIDRMRDGLPCETLSDNMMQGKTYWVPTDWLDFKKPNRTFRIPPEPRRVAREWEIEGGGCYEMIYGPIHVREVLPDEVWVKRMTEDEARVLCMVKSIGMPFSTVTEHCMKFARALGLIAEDKS